MLAFPHVCTENTNAHPIRPTFAATHGILHSLNLIGLVFQDASCNTTAINLWMFTIIGSIAHFHPHTLRLTLSSTVSLSVSTISSGCSGSSQASEQRLL